MYGFQVYFQPLQLVQFVLIRMKMSRDTMFYPKLRVGDDPCERANPLLPKLLEPFSFVESNQALRCEGSKACGFELSP